MPNMTDDEYREEVERYQRFLATAEEFDWLFRPLKPGEPVKLWWSLIDLSHQLELPKPQILTWIEKGAVRLWRRTGDGKFDYDIARSSLIQHLGREHTGWYRQNQSQVG